MGCCLLAATPILHQNTPDKKANCFVSSGKEPLQILTTQIQNRCIGKQTAENPWSSRLVLLLPFSGRGAARKTPGETLCGPFLPPPPPRAEKLRVGLSVRRLLPVTGRTPDHLRGVPWHTGMLPRHIPTFYCLFPVTGRNRRERAACHSRLFWTYRASTNIVLPTGKA